MSAKSSSSHHNHQSQQQQYLHQNSNNTHHNHYRSNSGGSHSHNHHHHQANDYFYQFHADEKKFNDKHTIQEAFKRFDKNLDGYLDIHEFEDVLKELFSFNGNPYYMHQAKVQSMFSYFNSSQTAKLSLNEFEKFWSKLVRPSLFPKTALVIVDVQNDFIDGTLALKNCPAKQDGIEVVPVINHMIDNVPFDVIAYSLDWHPADHCSFIENVYNRELSENSPVKTNIKKYDYVIFKEHPNIEQKLWPAHCVQESHGAKLNPQLREVSEASDALKRKIVYVYKGTDPSVDSYSAFFDNCKLKETTLDRDLQKHGITELYVCGLAADVCVAATSNHGIDLNYRVVYVEDAARGVDLKDIDEQKKKLVGRGAIMVNSNQVVNMVTGRDRRPELGIATLNALMGTTPS